MKKLLFVFGILFFLSFPKDILADEYSDYVHQMDVYKQARSEYDLARLNYLSSKTLAAKSAAQASTLKMLTARDDVVIAHLTIFKTDSEIEWYKGHKAELPSAGSLEDLVAESQKAKDRYETVTKILMYNALAERETRKVEGFRARMDKIIGDINAKLGEIRTNGDKNTQKAERWLIDVDDRLKRSDQKKADAATILGKLNDNYSNKASIFNDFQTLTIESNQFLKEGSSFLKEIVKEIRTAD